MLVVIVPLRSCRCCTRVDLARPKAVQNIFPRIRLDELGITLKALQETAIELPRSAYELIARSAVELFRGTYSIATHRIQMLHLIVKTCWLRFPAMVFSVASWDGAVPTSGVTRSMIRRMASRTTVEPFWLRASSVTGVPLWLFAITIAVTHPA